jgi:hypothetical protein
MPEAGTALVGLFGTKDHYLKNSGSSEQVNGIGHLIETKCLENIYLSLVYDIQR